MICGGATLNTIGRKIRDFRQKTVFFMLSNLDYRIIVVFYREFAFFRRIYVENTQY